MRKQKINIVTLGCSKNVVDSEYLMNQLSVGGWEVVHDSNDPSAKVVVINTCGFIGDAKEESIDTILRFCQAKEEGLIDRVYVMGCLSQRYKSELETEITSVDGYYGVSDLIDIVSELNVSYRPDLENRRLITTPNHYAYLKISEGCNWGCSYCAIPGIRGKHQSRKFEDIIDEAKSLASQGVKELLVIAQDTTYYGFDLYGERRVAELLTELEKIDGIEWIRLHYAYPTNFPTELLAVMASSSKICHYIDIPFQHISNNVLSKMRRGISKEETMTLINSMRAIVPDIAIRTTLLVGHPGETDVDFSELVEFVRAVKFDRLGVFTYSEEEGTYAANYFADEIPAEVKEQRMEEIMTLQSIISAQKNEDKVGKTFKVIVDRQEGEYWVGRTEFDSPEVDQEVLFVASEKANIQVGNFVSVTINRAEEYDLYGTI
ncbi:MAG: 30S ribosomal protein S12 methylthiotransferase RimO [Bacteroidales bacterium]|nr:30S ribosomal protein S12 methylthiotransferase RimO [Bacteroidales bacterium]MBN2749180.1 30S ribosomal protein S12 methylthiotransferase RimO [Bacteroidales bacterium]